MGPPRGAAGVSAAAALAQAPWLPLPSLADPVPAPWALMGYVQVDRLPFPWDKVKVN